MPGFVDVYSDKSGGGGGIIDGGAPNATSSAKDISASSSSPSSHGDRLLNFLLRNRAPSDSLPFQLLEGFNNTTKMRQNVLTSLLTKMKEAADKRDEETAMTGGGSCGGGESRGGGGENNIGSRAEARPEAGEELKLIAKCFSSMESSTNKADVGEKIKLGLAER